MKDYLCLIRQDEHQDWYMLCVKDEFFYCVSAGPLELVLGSARNFLKKYGTPIELSTALHAMESWPHKQPLHSHTLEAVYEAQGHMYDKLLWKELRSASFNPHRAEKKRKIALVAKKTKSLKLVVPKKKEEKPEVKKPTLVKPVTSMKKPLGKRTLKLRI